MAKLISVVTTFRNEEDIIPEFVARVRAVFEKLPEYDYEICFVDDDSTDRSAEILRKESAADPRIKLLITTRRFGVYPCLIAGLEAASGDAVIYLETDLQDPPEIIPEMVKRWEEGFEVVYTTRTKREGENPFKMALTAWAYKFIDWISPLRIPRNSGDYKLLSRRALQELLRIVEREPYFRGMVAWIGFKQSQVLYDRSERFAGETKRSLLSLAPLEVFLSAVLSFSNKPLYLIALAGLWALILCPIVVAVAFFFDRTLGNHLVVGLLLAMALVIQMSLGILALYLSRLIAEVKKWPLYLTREKVGFSLQGERRKANSESASIEATI